MAFFELSLPRVEISFLPRAKNHQLGLLHAFLLSGLNFLDMGIRERIAFRLGIAEPSMCVRVSSGSQKQVVQHNERGWFPAYNSPGVEPSHGLGCENGALCGTDNGAISI